MHTEKQIENYLKRKFESIGAIVLKFTSPGQAGVPDRLILLKGGRSIFVEVKKKGGVLSPLQKHWIEKINKHYHEVYVVWSYEDVDALLKKVGF
ncbi:nuclease [Bacillus phage Carmen17]|uniref:Nuclease n=1 Tax=Bacillus phage Carmen17 TaxID=2072797 RepID=A0A2I7QIL0_9CAUD|nr:endonuclease [Bacillus phage Carmen17]AUR81229.1 nuclease [Bacillus phage Carmen17]